MHLHVHNHIPEQPSLVGLTQAVALLANAVDTLAAGYQPSCALKNAVAAVKSGARQNDDLLPDLAGATSFAISGERGSAGLDKSTAIFQGINDMASAEEQVLIDDLKAAAASQAKTKAEVTALKEGYAAQGQNIATLEATIAALEAAGTPISQELKDAVALVKQTAADNDELLEDIVV